MLRAVISPLREVTHIHSVHTTHPGHAEEITAGLTRDDYDAVIVVGGDGTVGEAINGLVGSADPDPASLPLLVPVPTGSANVFARALGYPNVPGEAARKAARLLAAGITRTVPLGHVSGDRPRWFAVNVGCGLDGAVIAAMERLRRRGISASAGNYAWVTARAWAQMAAHPPQIMATATGVDGSTQTFTDVPLVLISKTIPWSYAGVVPLITNPAARVEAGLSVFALSSLTGFHGFAGMMRTFGAAGRHLLWGMDFTDVERRADDLAVVQLRADRQLPIQVDGEFYGRASELTVTSVPQVIEVVADPRDRFDDVLGFVNRVMEHTVTRIHEKTQIVLQDI